MVEMVDTKSERYFVQPLLAAAWLPDKYSAGAAPLTPPVEADNKMKSLSNKRQGSLLLLLLLLLLLSVDHQSQPVMPMQFKHLKGSSLTRGKVFQVPPSQPGSLWGKIYIL